MSEGHPAPKEVRDSLTLFIPKGEYASDVDRIIRRIKELCPITLMHSSAKVITSIADVELARIASGLPSAAGFIAGSHISDNLMDLEGGLYVFDQLLDALPAIILLDLAQAFPRLPIVGFGLFSEPSELALRSATSSRAYSDLSTTIFHNGQRLAMFGISSGIKQGCPLSGSILCRPLDPRASCPDHARERTDTTLRRRCCHSHQTPGAQLRGDHGDFREWAKATGLKLTYSKCSIVMGGAPEREFRVFVESSPEARLMQLVCSATYLGVMFGPGAPAAQCDSVVREVATRLPDVAAAHSIVGRLLLMGTYLSPLYQYKSQFTLPSASAESAYRHAQQTITNAPWMGTARPLLENLKGLGFRWSSAACTAPRSALVSGSLFGARSDQKSETECARRRTRTTQASIPAVAQALAHCDVGGHGNLDWCTASRGMHRGTQRRYEEVLGYRARRHGGRIFLLRDVLARRGLVYGG